MPDIIIYTNIKSENISGDFEEKTAHCVSSVLNKPKQHVHLVLHSDKRMYIKDSSSPCALLQIRAHAVLDAERNPTYTKKFLDFFSTILGIPPERISIVYVPLDPAMVGLTEEEMKLHS